MYVCMWVVTCNYQLWDCYISMCLLFLCNYGDRYGDHYHYYYLVMCNLQNEKLISFLYNYIADIYIWWRREKVLSRIKTGWDEWAETEKNFTVSGLYLVLLTCFYYA